VEQVLSDLPGDLAAAVLVVQHLERDRDSRLPWLLGLHTTLPVHPATNDAPILPGHVYVAVPDEHLLARAGHLVLDDSALVRFSRPSIDVLFESAAEAWRDRCVGVVLTGANADGAAGLARVAELGGAALVQDPATAERAEMPRAALEKVPEARVANLEELAVLLVELCGVEVHG